MYQRYFNDCPVLYVHGRTYPVDHYYIDDIYDFLAPQSILPPSRNNAIIDSIGKSRGGGHIDEPKFEPELIKDLIVKIISTPHLSSKHYFSLASLESAFVCFR